jgi:hypothetical protein
LSRAKKRPLPAIFESKPTAFAARVRLIERVRLHADLTILAKLSCALTRAQLLALAA